MLGCESRRLRRRVHGVLWYAYTVWRGKWHWTAKVWSVLLVIAAATVLHIAINYHLIGFSSTY